VLPVALTNAAWKQYDKKLFQNPEGLEQPLIAKRSKQMGLFQNFSFERATIKKHSFAGHRPKNCKSLLQN
jgi:hypothetical protein